MSLRQIEGAPTSFRNVVADVAVFAGPLLESVSESWEFDAEWVPAGPWAPRG